MELQSRTGYIGKSMPRKEDRRLLLGQGQYIADLTLPGMLHAVFVRSTVAHARIKSVDLSRAAAAPGVRFVMSGIELAKELPLELERVHPLSRVWRETIPHKIFQPREPLLAWDKVRNVGEAVAVVVADNHYLAEDAAELVEVDYELLPPVVDPEAALRPDSALLHERYGTNALVEFTIAKGDVDRAFARAPRTLKRRIYHHRYGAVPMECRGVAAAYDARADAVTIWSSTQVVHRVRSEAAVILGLPEARVRCLALDVGGGFGVKCHIYGEDLVLPYLARRIGRPVRWIEDRREHLQAACHSRDQIHDAEIAFDDSGKILALRDELIMDCGAWNPIGIGIPGNTACHIMGPYKIEHFAVHARAVATNKVANAPYRGAGRQEAVLVMERLMDLVARELGMEPAAVRRRNFVTPAEMPYSVGIPYRDGQPIVYDGGDYPRALDMVLEAVGGLDAFRLRQREARSKDLHLGLGLGFYVEGTGVGPFEGATVRIEPGGRISVASGACPQGQGMETIYSQITADLWKVKPDDVVVSLADTAVIPMGFGTIASRSTVNVSSAIYVASERLRKKVFAIAANMLECAAADLELRDGRICVVGSPGTSVSLADLERASRPGWNHRRPEGVDAGLEETYYWEPPTVTWSYAVHAVVVDVDVELGHVKLEQYAIAHDCGVVVNPMLADGQVMGGTVQGIGGALFEEYSYDAEGQLLTGSLADYLIPTASDVPSFKLLHLESPSRLTPLGVKGLGEGGAISPPAAIANAVCDALAPFGVEFNATPIKPESIFRAVRGVAPSTPRAA